MFVPIDEKPIVGQRPAASAISPNDWVVLADFWYPVAISAEVTDAPVAAKILDVDLVVYRGADNEIAIAIDMCPHRHVRLSGGRMVDGQVECPFHGLRFDTSGQCRLVPALGREARLPATYRVKTYPVEQRYGLIWTCIGDPTKSEIPDLPTIADVDPSDLTFGPPSDWPISAPRQIENFIDLAHLPFVHAKTLGGDQARALKPGKIEQTNDSVILHAQYVEHDESGADVEAVYRYRVVLPFTIDFTVRYPGNPDRKLVSVNVVTPASAYVSRVFQIHKIDGDLAMRQAIVNVLEAVNVEDVEILSGLARPDLPLDQHHEIHLPVDNICHAYRTRLRAFGLGKRELEPA